MREKIVSILVCMLLIVTSFGILSNKNTVQAEEQEEESGSDLDLEYLWTKINAVAEVIHDAYSPGDIRKGRFMGSKGGIFCRDLIKDELTNMSLSNVRTEKLEQIGTTPIFYNRLLDVVGYNLTVNIDEEPYSYDIPKSEFFPTTCTKLKIPEGYDYTIEFEDAKIFYNNLRTLLPDSWFDSNYVISEYSTYNEDGNEPIGKLEYLTEQSQIPVNQSGRVYLLYRDNYTKDFLDNLTYAEGVVLINSGKEVPIEYSDYTFQIKEIQESEGDDLIDILNNNSDAIIDTLFDNITINYEFNDSFLPSNDYVVIDRIPNHTELAEDTSMLLRLIAGWYDTPTILDYFTCAFIWSEYFRDMASKLILTLQRHFRLYQQSF